MAIDPLPAVTTATVFLAVDVETTGLGSRSNRIVEIAGVRFTPGGPSEEKTWLVNPGMPIPPEATRIHGITDEMVSNQPPFEAVFPLFASWAEGCVLLAHNARFDRRFIETEATRCGFEFKPLAMVDTLPLFREWFPEARRHTLEDLARYAEPRATNFHRALSDVTTLKLLFETGLRRRDGKAVARPTQIPAPGAPGAP